MDSFFFLLKQHHKGWRFSSSIDFASSCLRLHQLFLLSVSLFLHPVIYCFRFSFSLSFISFSFSFKTFFLALFLHFLFSFSFIDPTFSLSFFFLSVCLSVLTIDSFSGFQVFSFSLLSTVFIH